MSTTIKSTKDKKKKHGAEAAISISAFGFTISSLISWSLYQSVAWTILHGLFGWFYILYWVITQDPDAETFNNILEFYKN